MNSNNDSKGHLFDDLRSTADTLHVGDEAPDFTLPTPNEGELHLAWYRWRTNVVLAFYPGDFSPVCATLIPDYKAVIDKFEL